MHQKYQHQIILVTDRIHKGHMPVELYPTGETTRDFLTKPNQVYIFKIFRDLVIGVIPHRDPSNGKQDNRKNNKNNKIKQE